MSGPADKTAASSVGERLRAARERLGLTLQKVSEDLHLDVPILEAMEENRFRTLGAPVYARGHLRKYANLLGLDASGVLADYEAAHTGPVAPNLAPSVGEHPVIAPERAQGSTNWVLMGVIVAVAAAVGAGAWWYFGPHRHAVAVTTSPMETETAPGATPVIEEAQVQTAAASGPVAPPPQSEGKPLAAATPATGSPARLRLKFQADSWVEIYDASGVRLLFDQRTAGTARTLVGVPPFKVLLGNYSGVELTYNGHAVAIPERAEIGATARFRVLPGGTAVALWSAQ